jgi:hypothetical protein
LKLRDDQANDGPQWNDDNRIIQNKSLAAHYFKLSANQSHFDRRWNSTRQIICCSLFAVHWLTSDSPVLLMATE